MSARTVFPFLAAVLFATPALADQAGSTGRVVRVTVNTSASDDYTSFRGSMTLRQSKDGRRIEYSWGGTKCPGSNLSEEQVALLGRALSDRRITMVPKYKPGQDSGTRCLVGFQLRR